MLFAASVVAQEQSSVSLRNDASFDLRAGSSFSASSAASRKISSNSSRIASITADLTEAFDVIAANSSSFKPSKTESIFASAIDEALLQLDPHSNYYTRKQFRELNDDNRGRYFGTGMSISDFEKDGQTGVYIVSVAKNSPAEKAGFRFGDKLIAVNGKNVSTLDPEQVRDLVRGPEGSSVSIKIERANGLVATGSTRRAQVPQRSVEHSFMVDDSTGYVSIGGGFTYTTVAEFDAAYARLKRSGMRSLMIDLRGNGGGLMEQSILLAERFLPARRRIVSQRGRYETTKREWISRNPRPETLPLVVLVDENTASASEIFAAAMQDNDRAVIVGARTYGKGLVQNVIALADGAGLTLTSERYYAPSGRSIQREYSDGHLYDYYRHLNTGSLIDKPAFAAKTLSGRTVYGGNGIEPDIIVESKKWTEKDLQEYEAAFFEARQIIAGGTDPENVSNAIVRSFLAASAGDKISAARLLQESDQQLLGAIKAARNQINTPK